jgi:hypothetical protein
VALNENLELKTKEIGRGDEIAELQKENFRKRGILEESPH